MNCEEDFSLPIVVCPLKQCRKFHKEYEHKNSKTKRNQTEMGDGLVRLAEERVAWHTHKNWETGLELNWTSGANNIWFWAPLTHTHTHTYRKSSSHSGHMNYDQHEIKNTQKTTATLPTHTQQETAGSEQWLHLHWKFCPTFSKVLNFKNCVRWSWEIENNLDSDKKRLMKAN